MLTNNCLEPFPVVVVFREVVEGVAHPVDGRDEPDGAGPERGARGRLGTAERALFDHLTRRLRRSVLVLQREPT